MNAELSLFERPTLSSQIKMAPKDYASDQEIRWCPGCGDYAILKAVEKALADLRADPERTVFVSGIGCASRFPYYLATYGFHTIHGRAAAFATGIKLASPELDVWVVSGDGDSLSIGGNHLLHLLRRNVDVNYLLFNNEIYGLTKGQFSPTSRLGTVSPSMPSGSVDAPVQAIAFALGCGARFVARGVDILQNPLVDVLKRAHAFRGTSFVEILQNCVVFNDGIFDTLTDKKVSSDHLIWVEHGKPLVFGKNHEKGLRQKPGKFELEVVPCDKDLKNVLIHDETDHILATMLAKLPSPQFPTPLGVLYCQPGERFEQHYRAPTVPDGAADLDKLFRQGYTWKVGG